MNKEIEIIEEFEKAKMHLLAITELKRKGQGIIETEGEHILIYSGVPISERAQAGVGCIINKEWKKGIQSWEFISERILKIELKNIIQETVTAIIVYGPNDNGKAEEKDNFWMKLQETVETSKGKILILGDFNSRVGNNNEGIEEIMGIFGEQEKNNNGDRMIDFCLMNNLVISNSTFKHKDIHKFTRVEPAKDEKSIIDYILIERDNRKILKDVRVMRGFEIGSDHYLVKGKVKTETDQATANCATTRKQSPKEKIRTYKLKNEEIREHYVETVEKEISNLKKLDEKNVNELWEIFKKIIMKAARETCGTLKITPNKKQTAWWNKEIKENVRDKKRKWKNYLNTKSEANYLEYKQQRKRVKELILQAKREAWETFGVELEENSKKNNKLFYNILKKTRRGKDTKLPQLKNKEGKILSDSNKIMERWKEYFQELLEADSNEDKVQSTNKPKRPSQENLSGTKITEEEIKTGIQKMRIGKAAGKDTITPEMIKYLGENGIKLLHKIFNLAWKDNQIPLDWESAIIVPIYKKGDNRDCSNYRGISLLCTTEKLYESILTAKLYKHVDNLLEESQSGFRKGRCTQDHIFTLRQIQEKTIEYKNKAYICFIDLTKAFDKVKRAQVWETLQKYNVEEDLLSAIKCIYKKTRNYVVQGNLESKEFITTEGLRQGGSLSPLLFIILMDDIVKEIKTSSKQLPIGYRNLKQTGINECAFADDVVIYAKSEKDLQRNLDAWKEALDRRQMKINGSKTKVMVISREEEQIQILLENKKLEQVSSFKYLGSIFESTGGNEKDVDSRIKATVSTFYALKNTLINKKEISKNTKIKIYKTIYLPTLTYGCESWVLSDRQKSKLQATEMKFLRRVENITKLDRIKNEDIRDRLQVTPVLKSIESQQLRWFGHLVRMKESNQVKTIWETKMTGKRPRGRPNKTWNDSITQILRKQNITWKEATKLAKNRKAWRNQIQRIEKH